MLAAFKKGLWPREILDLTAPADDGDGIVDRWLRDSTARAGDDGADAAIREAQPREERTG